MRRLAVLGVVVLASLARQVHAEDAPAPAAPSPGADEALRAEVARQGAELASLKASVEEQRMRDAGDKLAFHLSGFTQVDWTIHDQLSQNEINGATGALLNQDRFTLRRGHVRIDVEKGLVLGCVEIDANTVSGPQVRPIDAEVSLRWPEKPDARLPSVLVSAGLMRIPFGYEVQELDYVRPFLERASVLQAMFPGEYDLGARVKVKYRFLDGALALMNGNPIGDKVFPDLAPVGAKDIVGRLGVDVGLTSAVRFQAGASAVEGTGFHQGTPATKSQLVWQDVNGDGLVEPNEIVAVGGSPATPSQTFHRFAIGGDARLLVAVPRLGQLALRGEVVAGENIDRGLELADPVGADHDLREVGWSAGVTQEITKWAMIGVRYDRYNPDADASQQRALNLVPLDRTYSTTALMVMARYESTARLLLEYDINKNPLGVDASGTPTTLADNALTLRAQLVY